MNERMKTKNHDQLDAHNSIFAAARCSDDHSVSKTTPFADISERVQEFPNPCFCDPFRVVFIVRANRGFPLRFNPRLISDKPSACGNVNYLSKAQSAKIKTRIAAGFVFVNNFLPNLTQSLPARRCCRRIFRS
jgi:hypothetical protein